MNIYLDMDDVVADWMAAAYQIVNRKWEYGERIPDSDWDKVKAKERFYRTLPLKAGAYELVAWCREYCRRNPGTQLAFLTAIPHDYSVPYAQMDKIAWANLHFEGIPVFFGPFSYDKYKHCQGPDDILIDDRHSNCHEFIAAGGRAHIYRTWPECHTWLEATLGPL
jgi:hypothetical protein